MRERGLEVRNAGQENCLGAVMMVSLEHELVPIVQIEAALQQVVQRTSFVVGLKPHHVPPEKLRPFVLAIPNQDVGRSENNVVRGKFW